jgi:hypothetical protein
MENENIFSERREMDLEPQADQETVQGGLGYLQGISVSNKDRNGQEVENDRDGFLGAGISPSDSQTSKEAGLDQRGNISGGKKDRDNFLERQGIDDDQIFDKCVAADTTASKSSQTSKEAGRDLKKSARVKNKRQGNHGAEKEQTSEDDTDANKEACVSSLQTTAGQGTKKRLMNKEGSVESEGITRYDSGSETEAQGSRGMCTRSRGILSARKETDLGQTPVNNTDKSNRLTTSGIRRGTAILSLQDKKGMTLQQEMEDEDRMATVPEDDEKEDEMQASNSISQEGNEDGSRQSSMVAPRTYQEDVAVDYEVSSDEETSAPTDVRTAMGSPHEFLNMSREGEGDDSTASPFTQVNSKKRKEQHGLPPMSASSSECSLSSMSVSSNSTKSKTTTTFAFGWWQQSQSVGTDAAEGPEEGDGRIDRVRRKVLPSLPQQINMEARVRREQHKEELRRKQERMEVMRALSEFHPAPDDQQERLSGQAEMEKGRMSWMADVDDISHMASFDTSYLLVQGIPTWFSMARFKSEMTRLLDDFEVYIKNDNTIWPQLCEVSRASMYAVTTAVVCTSRLKCGGDTGFRVGNGKTGHFPAVLFHTAEGAYHGTQEWTAEFTICPIPAEQRECWQLTTSPITKNLYRLRRTTVGLIRHCGTNPAEIEFKMRVAQRRFEEFNLGQVKAELLCRVLRKVHTSGVEHLIVLEVAPSPNERISEQLKNHMRNHREGLRHHTVVLPMAPAFKDVVLERGKIHLPFATRMSGLRAHTTHGDIIEAVALHPGVKSCLQGVLMSMNTIQVNGAEVDVAEATLIWGNVRELPFICPLTANPGSFTHDEYFLDGSVIAALLQQQANLLDDLLKPRIVFTETSEAKWWEQEVGEGDRCKTCSIYCTDYLAARCWSERRGSPDDDVKRGWTVLMKKHNSLEPQSARDRKREADSSDLGTLWRTLLPIFSTEMDADESFERYLQWCSTSEVRRSAREELDMNALERKAMMLSPDVAIWKIGESGVTFRLLLPEGGEADGRVVENMLARPIWVVQIGYAYRLVVMQKGLRTARDGLMDRVQNHIHG